MICGKILWVDLVNSKYICFIANLFAMHFITWEKITMFDSPFYMHNHLLNGSQSSNKFSKNTIPSYQQIYLFKFYDRLNKNKKKRISLRKVNT